MKHKTTRSEEMCIDAYYETKYTANTVKNILELKNNTTFICKKCCIEPVDSNISIQDMYYPTFVVTRKKYCLSCWLSYVTLNKTTST